MWVKEMLMKKKMVKSMVDRREPTRTAAGFSWSWRYMKHPR